MTCRCAPASRPHVLYFAEVDYGRKLGRAFQQLDRDDNSRAEIVRQIRNGDDVILVLEIDEQSGTSRDVTEELHAEAAEAREAPSLQDSFNRLEQLRDHNRSLRKESV